MYCYIIDPNYIANNKLEKTIIEIEQTLHSLGIFGPFIKIKQFDSLSLSIAQQKRNGVHTCIAIGDDALFLETINAIQEDKVMTIGYIPLDKKSLVATKFKIPFGKEACQTIANRHIVDHSLGIMNNYYKFIDFVAIEGVNMSFICDNLYKVKTGKKTIVSISKNQFFTITIQEPQSFLQKKEKVSHFSCKEILFDSKPGNFEIVFPQYSQISLPVKIQSLPYPHHIIMGKHFTI